MAKTTSMPNFSSSPWAIRVTCGTPGRPCPRLCWPLTRHGCGQGPTCPGPYIHGRGPACPFSGAVEGDRGVVSKAVTAISAGVPVAAAVKATAMAAIELEMTAVTGWGLWMVRSTAVLKFEFPPINTFLQFRLHYPHAIAAIAKLPHNL